MEIKFLCKTEDDTVLLGTLLGKQLKSGDTLCLEGDLGAGKTTFTKAICTSLGINSDDVTSPTFAIMNIYDGIETVKHFDLYRLTTKSELVGTGFDEYLEQEGINIIEWSDLFPDSMPARKLTIKINITPEERELTFTSDDARYKEISTEVKNAYSGH